MKTLFISLALLCTRPVMGCDADFVREYFTQDGHEYLMVTGYCRGKVQYTVHVQECPCGEGLYEVQGPTGVPGIPPVKGPNGPAQPK